MLKYYIVNGKQYQYEEGEQPEGAVELKPKKEKKPEQENADDKSAKPSDKSGKVETK